MLTIKQMAPTMQHNDFIFLGVLWSFFAQACCVTLCFSAIYLTLVLLCILMMLSQHRHLPDDILIIGVHAAEIDAITDTSAAFIDARPDDIVLTSILMGVDQGLH